MKLGGNSMEEKIQHSVSGALERSMYAAVKRPTDEEGANFSPGVMGTGGRVAMMWAWGDW